MPTVSSSPEYYNSFMMHQAGILRHLKRSVLASLACWMTGCEELVLSMPGSRWQWTSWDHYLNPWEVINAHILNCCRWLLHEMDGGICNTKQGSRYCGWGIFIPFSWLVLMSITFLHWSRLELWICTIKDLCTLLGVNKNRASPYNS